LDKVVSLEKSAQQDKAALLEAKKNLESVENKIKNVEGLVEILAKDLQVCLPVLHSDENKLDQRLVTDLKTKLSEKLQTLEDIEELKPFLQSISVARNENQKLIDILLNNFKVQIQQWYLVIFN
jgi:archaellum component FlaC